MTVSKIPSVLTVNSPTKPHAPDEPVLCWVFKGNRRNRNGRKKIGVAESWWSVYSNWWMYNIDSIPTTVCFLMIAFHHCIGQQRRFCSSILRVQKLKIGDSEVRSILKFGSWLFFGQISSRPKRQNRKGHPFRGSQMPKKIQGLAIIEICPDWFLCFSKPIHHRIKHQTAWRYASYLEDGLPVSFSG